MWSDFVDHFPTPTPKPLLHLFYERELRVSQKTITFSITITTMFYQVNSNIW